MAGKAAATRQANQARATHPPFRQLAPKSAARQKQRRRPRRHDDGDDDAEDDSDPDTIKAVQRYATQAAAKARRAQPPAVSSLDAVDVDLKDMRLLSKLQVMDRVGVCFPTLWKWMRAGTFPRSRALGGSTVWIASEVEAWMASLPMRPLKGDPEPNRGSGISHVRKLQRRRTVLADARWSAR